MCIHKDNELCKENFDHIVNINNEIDNEENHHFDDDLDDLSDDLDIDLDETHQANFCQNIIDQEKKRPRRKYTKNKINSSSTFICESKNSY